MSYEDLKFLPRINGVTVIGDRKLEYFGLVPMTDAEIASNNAEACAWIGLANYINK